MFCANFSEEVIPPIQVSMSDLPEVLQNSRLVERSHQKRARLHKRGFTSSNEINVLFWCTCLIFLVAGNRLVDGQVEAEASEPPPAEEQQHRGHLGKLTTTKRRLELRRVWKSKGKMKVGE